MSDHDAFGWLRALEVRMLRKRVEEMAAVAPEAEDEQGKLRAQAATKLEAGSHLTREEVAAHLDVSTRKVQRMDAKGELRRCPGLGSVVRYSSSDVLRLATGRREGA